jgi:hypothetical protein
MATRVMFDGDARRESSLDPGALERAHTAGALRPDPDADVLLHLEGRFLAGRSPADPFWLWPPRVFGFACWKRFHLT